MACNTTCAKVCLACVSDTEASVVLTCCRRALHKMQHYMHSRGSSTSVSMITVGVWSNVIVQTVRVCHAVFQIQISM